MKKILFSLTIGLSLLSLVAQEAEKIFTLENTVQDNEFYAEYVYGLKSMANGQHYCSTVHGNILVYAYKTGDLIDTLVRQRELILPDEDTPIRFRDYTFSQDEKKILIPTRTERIYRWSSKSDYFVFDLDTKKVSAVSENGKQRLADFSPDGTKVAFVRENNLFIKNLISGEEEQITFDGKDRYIINGTTDWVYEEEFGFVKGFYWSPDGSKIAFYRFDESNVVEYEMQMWGELYPEMHKYKYPKAGEDNSIVSIHIYDVASGKSNAVNIGEEKDQYIPRIKWTKKAGVLSILRLNRLQNQLEILLANAENGETEIIYNEENKYYIDITDHLTFIDEDHFLFTSEADGYYHIYFYNIDGTLIKQLTKGEWDVSDILGFDDKRSLVYFTAAKSSPLNRDVLSVSLNGKINSLDARLGTNDASFSSNFDYYINTFTDANTPPYITLNKNNGKVIRLLQDNEELNEKLQEYGYQQREFFSITTDSNVTLNAWKILPEGFDPNTEYPILMYVYGGPGSQTVQNNWGGGNLWYQLLAQRGIVCISVDNRGTGSRGEEFKKMTYLQLGKYETIDQIAAAKYLGQQSWVDG